MRILFRLRKIASILHFRELEDQYIYFSPLNDENDRYEGKSIAYLKCDENQWKSFFLNFYRFICLYTQANLLGITDIPFSNLAIPPLKSNTNFTKYPGIQRFSSSVGVKTFSSKLADQEITVYIFQLRILLFLLVQYSLLYIAESGVSPQSNTRLFVNSRINKLNNLFEGIGSNEFELFQKEKFDEFLKTIPQMVKEVFKEMDNDVHKIPSRNDCVNQKLPNAFVDASATFDLVDDYIDGILRMTLESSYAASFLTDSANDSMWERYAGNDGVCLEFPDSGLDLKIKNAIQHLNYQKVHYGSKPHFNIIDNLGLLTVNQINILFGNSFNQITSSFNQITSGNEDLWRKKYWRNSQDAALFKSSAWKSENESRLILTENFIDDFECPLSLRAHYKFEDLRSLTFGPDTSNVNMNKILEILDKKCKQNGINNFQTYIVKMNERSGKVKRNAFKKINQK